MTEPLFFIPIFQERIWGGEKLTTFGYEIPSNRTGECWAFAAHEHGQSIVKNGKYKGESLSDLWDNHRELFGNMEGDRFPLLTKILDANDDLSVQVHPDDKFANRYENGELGKTECWYIVDCDKEAEIIFGHHAKSREQFIQLINDGKWDELLHKVSVKPGDFFFVPSGTIHAIGKGILILETQQNSDTTYRVYDYGRVDSNGNKRELHIEKSIQVANIPSHQPKINPQKTTIDDLEITTFIETEFFTVHKWKLIGHVTLKQTKPFQLLSVISGEGYIIVNNQTFSFQKGDHILLPSEFGDFVLKGESEIIVSHL
ncbi:mannose-6-phosphate isomerase, class I [Robertmurraya kyonggiensis]|uniref:Mannose-6-phosphate isomerase n=1 Tax=Robertmurraya kyonggiensis TaxID=1037680 RepID=A0A4U1D3V4_9BACI|nr:mannose-6-phosphate isomerase, class I [Robertmurraya kyonggiensis]TKC17011.1 mannose-6-phosphate isomerase, class I [Robertmurraya kyonggiensis]